MSNKKNAVAESNEENQSLILGNLSSEKTEVLFDAMKDKPNYEFIELTSELLKIEEGQSIDCIFTNQRETLTNEDGENYEACVLHTRDGKALIADVVALSVAERFFKENPEVIQFACRIINKGERVSGNGKNKYRDLKILAAKI